MADHDTPPVAGDETRDETAWMPDQPLRADATRQNILDRLAHLNSQASAGHREAVGPWFVAALVVEMQNACLAALRSAPDAAAPVAWQKVFAVVNRTLPNFEDREQVMAELTRDILALYSAPASGEQRTDVTEEDVNALDEILCRELLPSGREFHARILAALRARQGENNAD